MVGMETVNHKPNVRSPPHVINVSVADARSEYYYLRHFFRLNITPYKTQLHCFKTLDLTISCWHADQLPNCSSWSQQNTHVRRKLYY